MDEQTRKRIEELEARAAALAAEISALKAEAEPKYHAGDTVMVRVKLARNADNEGDYRVDHCDGKSVSLAGWVKDAAIIPAVPALVPVDPAALKPGDEVYVKAKFSKINSTPGVIDVHVYCGAYNLVNNFDANTVYQVR